MKKICLGYSHFEKLRLGKQRDCLFLPSEHSNKIKSVRRYNKTWVMLNTYLPNLERFYEKGK